MRVLIVIEEDIMSFLDTINSFTRRVFDNADPEPYTIEELGSDEDDYNDNDESIDLVDHVPFRVKRTIKNCLFASKEYQVKGILLDIVTKTNNEWYIEGDNEEAVKYIEEYCKLIDLNQWIDEILEKGLVQGEAFINRYTRDDHIMLRWLAFDGENYTMKKVYDEYGEVIGYAQRTLRNKNNVKNWESKGYEELREDLVEKVFKFQPEQIINIQYAKRYGKGQSIVMDVLDLVYYKMSLIPLLPTTVFKNSNLVHVTMGNETQQGKRLTRKDRETVKNAVNDYHKKGTVMLPYGVDIDVLKGGSLPDIPSYIKSLESMIYVGLNTPEAIFSSESSNRATADIQLDSPTTGRVLFLQYNQEWLRRIVEEEIFKPELELHGYGDVEVRLKFNTDDLTDNDEDNKHRPIHKVNEDTDENTDEDKEDGGDYTEE